MEQLWYKDRSTSATEDYTAAMSCLRLVVELPGLLPSQPGGHVLGLVWICFVWTGLVRFGFGLDWFGLV